MRYPSSCRTIAAFFLLSACLPASAVIDRIEQAGCPTRRPNETITLRNAPNGPDRLWVYGLGVDFASRVTVTGIERVTAMIVRRRGGLGSAVEVRFSIPPDVRDGDEGRVTLHYPLGEDTFRIRTLSRPQVRSIEIDKTKLVSEPFYTIRVGDEHTFTVTGTDLANVTFRPSEEMRAATSFRVESQDDGRMRIRFRALRPGRFFVTTNHLRTGGPACLDFGVVSLPIAVGRTVVIEP